MMASCMSPSLSVFLLDSNVMLTHSASSPLFVWRLTGAGNQLSTDSLKKKLRQRAAASHRVCVSVYAGASVKCAHIWMPSRIVVFKQSTWESETKLNFEPVNHHTFSSLSKSNHRWLDQTVCLALVKGFLLSTCKFEKASTHSERRPVGLCIQCVHEWLCPLGLGCTLEL